MKQIFISYSRKDISFVEQLARDLKNAGFDAWYDVSGISGGSRWRVEIETALRNSQFLIVVLSPDSIISEWVEREFLFASNLKLKIIPLMYRACELPLNYLDLNYIDVQGGKYRQNFDELLQALSLGTGPDTVPAAKPGKPSFSLKAGLLLATIGAIGALSIALLVIFPSMFSKATESPTSTPLSADLSETPVPMTATETLQPSLTPTATPTATLTQLPTEVTDAKGVEMAFVPAGEFAMGSDNSSADEQPVHTVNLAAFYMDKYEVSNGRYKACVEAGICQPLRNTSSALHNYYYDNPDYDSFPVIYVNWNMAQSYCGWREARLPTEAEWEKAARGDSNFIYPWGDVVDCNRANYGQCTGDVASVNIYARGASVYGIYNMAGNVWEWVNDWYADTYYQYSPQDNPQGPDTGKKKVLRGGSWSDNSSEVRSVNRYAEDTANFNRFVGFRCAVDAKP